jgi:autotransporter strand-loop-strand O-heptosyltransferase
MLETESSNNLFSFAFDTTQRQKEDVSIVLLFTKGPKVEIKGDIGVPFQVTFLNKTTGEVEYDGLLRGNNAIQAGAAYYQDWKIIVKQQDRVFLDYDLDLNNANVFISHESQGFGDNLAWMPYVDEFRKRHNCNVTCQTAFPELFEKVYPEIKFINAGGVAENIFAHFRLGCYRPTEKDKVFSPPIEWWKHPLQEIAKHQLGLADLGEIRPKVYFDETQDIHKDMKNFVCIATRSTMRCKEWQNTKGWLSLTRWLRSKGLGVVNISRKGMKLEGVQNVADDESFQSIMSYLRHSKFLIGLSSGLSWLAWALHKQVVIINGFANPIPEFSDAIHVGPPPNVCSGCYQNHMLDIFDFDWCPEDQNFNCTRTITPEMVQAKVEPLL